MMETCFLSALQEGKNVYVGKKDSQYDEVEIMMNKPDNFIKKLAYYKKHYTSDLVNTSNEQIEIVSFGTILPFNMPREL